MDQSEMPACESCGEDHYPRTRNRLPEGTRLVLCGSCVRKVMRLWREWRRQAPEQATQLIAEARREQRRRTLAARAGGSR